LNRFDQFVTPVDNIDIHYLHERISGDTAVPLLLSRGWPGSFAEFSKIVEPLANPERRDPLERDAARRALRGNGGTWTTR